MAQSHSLRRVHLEYRNSCTASWSLPNDDGAIPVEVVVPNIRAWIEQYGDRVAYGIDATQISALVAIESQTSQREVFLGVGAPMLLGDDVVDGKHFDVKAFGEVAVFTAPCGTIRKSLAQPLIHQSGRRGMLSK